MSNRRNRPKGYIPGKGPGNEGRFGNGPPEGESWMWLSNEMLSSPAWMAMPINARKVVDRVMIEHMSHAGTMNGALRVTYDDLVDYGIRRQSIAQAIRIAVALGWLDVTVKGGRSFGGTKRPAQYAFTCLPRHDGSPKTNRWRNYDDITSTRLLKEIRGKGKEHEPRSPSPPPSQDIYSSVGSEPRANDRFPAKAALP